MNLWYNIVGRVVSVNFRSTWRKILNEAELADALRFLAHVDVIEFSGMTFRDQASSPFLPRCM